MSRGVELPNSDRSKEEAAAWIARLDSGGMTNAELFELREWSRKSPEHRAELERMAGLWDKLDILTEYGDWISPRYAASRPRRVASWKTLAIAAGIATLTVVTWMAISSNIDAPVQSSDQSMTSPLVDAGVFSTAIGEQRSLPLADGSFIKMNTNSQLKVEYSSERRAVRLDQGEAYFEVAHDPGRPFVVKTAHGEITAMGTAFSVRLRDRAVEVTVQSGAVSLARRPEVDNQATLSAEIQTQTLLEAGQTAWLDESHDVVNTLEPGRLMRELAWRDGMLIFEGDSLAEVIAEVSRYDEVEIVISDPALRERRIGGYFQTGETDVLLSALESDFDIRVERVNNKIIYLHPAQR